MPKYYVTLYTTSAHTIEVEAADKSAAEITAYAQWEEGSLGFDEESLGVDGAAHVERARPRTDPPQAQASGDA